MTKLDKLPVEVINHYNNLCLYRQSGQVLEAGKYWLDKEISDIETDAGIKS